MPGPLKASIAFAIITVLALGAFFRFNAITEIGLRGDDTIYYLSLIAGQAEPLRDPFRPFIMGIYSLIVSQFGHPTISIKLFNASLGVLNIALTGLLAWQVSQRALIGWTSALLVAMSPRLIAFDRTELLHTASTSLLLCALVFLVAGFGSRHFWHRRILFSLSGLVCGFNVGVHESTLGFIVALGAALVLHVSVVRKKAHSFLRGLVELVVFSFFSLVYPIATGAHEIFFQHGQSMASTPRLTPFASDPLSYYFAIADTFRLNTSDALISTLCVSAILLTVRKALRLFPRLGSTAPHLDGQMYDSGNNRGRPLIALIALPVVYTLFYPLISPTVVFPRLFLPLVPAIYILLGLVIYEAFRTLLHFGRPKHSFICLIISLSAINFYTANTRSQNMIESIPLDQRSLFKVYTPITVPEAPFDLFTGENTPVSGYQTVFNLLQHKVDSNATLLVMPHSISSAHGERRGFSHYFGPNAVYIEDCDDSLDSFLAENSVRFLVVGTFHAKNHITSAPCLGINEENYTLDRDIRAFEKWRQKSGLILKELLFQPGIYVAEFHHDG